MAERFSLETIRAAAEAVHELVPPTPQLVWPEVCQRLGTEVWVKHENHAPTASFKVRGMAFLLGRLRQRGVKGVMAGACGNHAEAVAWAARAVGLHATVVVPRGHSAEKDRSIRVHGADLVHHGDRMAETVEMAVDLASERRDHLVPSFDLDLVLGHASLALELFHEAGELDAVYVPVGSGALLCAVLAVRDALNYRTEIIGAVPEQASAWADSFEAGRTVKVAPGETVADALVVREPQEAAFGWAQARTERFTAVDENHIQAAMCHLLMDTHNLAEGAGAIAFAAAAQDRHKLRGRRVGVLLSGANADLELFAGVFGATAGAHALP